ncbi:MAG: hydrolase [Patescibacteria group bacterium]|nr:MAG: hydrolase [Patescibacteria group bacterium]
MQKYKAIVSDFDGTLVDHSQQMTQAAKDAIREFVKNGGVFSIATGRGYPGILEKTCKELGLKHPVIVRGGSEIISTETDEILWAKHINPDTLARLIEHLSELDFFFAAERGQYVYSIDGKVDAEFGAGADFLDIKDMPLDGVPKAVIPPLYPLELVEPVLEKIINLFPDLHVVKTSSKKGVGIDINEGGAGKHMALLAYAKIMDFDPQEIIGVGDSYNDYPLLSACGLKISMANAPTELKEIADFVVANQENDGIIEVLKIY